MGKHKYLLLQVLAILWLAIIPVSAQTILYVPIDDRPVNLEYVVDTARAAGVNVVTPPAAFLGSLNKAGDPDGLWRWLLGRAGAADGVVVSSDSLLYGGLMPSRTHNLSLQTIEDRLGYFARLKALNPKMKLYVFSTVMRTPQSGGDGEEPPYYEIYGPDIFRITALRDQEAAQELSFGEKRELSALLNKVPQPVLSDWYDRRAKNFAANQRLINYTKKGTFAYFLLGRDDCAPYSQSHLESRRLAAETAGLPRETYASFPGADELGMLLITRAINQAAGRKPTVRVLFAPGTGADTVPSYEDVAVGETIDAHILAAGGTPSTSGSADLVLAINTPGDGITREADSSFNRAAFRAAPAALVRDIAYEMEDGRRIAVADIAFANGADNALMAEMSEHELLFKLDAYAGWNTASNALGYAIGQGMMAASMPATAKNKILTVRLLDDWAYQANVRAEVGREVLFPLGGSWGCLDRLTPRITRETDWRLQNFAAVNFPAYPLKDFQVSFPLNRMFEIKVALP